ncbi:MAG: SDR family oxidoreductase [Allosphingosinicella sp.]
MDLGISGRNAIVCASSRGLGRACAEALAQAGARVAITGLDPARLARTRDEIAAATGAEIHAVPGDVSTAKGRAALLAAFPQVDILVNNNGGPPPRDFREVDHDALIAGVARSIAEANVTINNLLPGQFDTDRITALVDNQARRTGRDPDEIRRQREQAIPARRFGDPAEFGAACAFLCSDQAGYITGQSLLIDGGAFPGIL